MDKVVVGVILVSQLLVAGLLMGSRKKSYEVLGIDTPCLAGLAASFWVGSQYSLSVVIYWPLLKRQEWINQERLFLYVLLAGIIGVILFWPLYEFILAKLDLQNITVATAAFISFPFLLLASVTAATSTVVLIAFAAGILISFAVFFTAEKRNLFPAESAEMAFLVFISAVGSTAGVVTGYAFSMVLGAIIGLATGAVILGLAIGVTSGAVWLFEHAWLPICSVLLKTVYHRRIICEHCYRLSYPLKSKYESGKRRCDHCGREISYSKMTGEVIAVFGTTYYPQREREFVFHNYDFSSMNHAIDISKVFIGQDADPLLIEKFVTYCKALYPPRRGADSVKVFHHGQLESVGGLYLRNLLLNSFTTVEEV